MNDQDVVLKALKSIGLRREAEYYLRQFQQSKDQIFAAIVLDDSACIEMVESLALDLRFLLRLSLYPLLITGFPAAESGTKGLSALRRCLEEASSIRLTQAMSATDIASMVIQPSQIPTVHVSDACTLSGCTPDRWVAQLLGEMQIGRVLLLHIEGGIHQDGIGLDLLTFGEESNKLLDACQLDELQQQLLQAAETLQRLSAIELRISVTSPLNLLEELFTTKGKGTLLRRPANIEMYESYEHIQTDRLTALIEEGFGNKLPTHFIERPVSRIYIIDDYKGAAILAATSVGQYLTKFVVSPRYQGEGLGKDLWIRMCAENARLFWRSNPDRPVNEWYAKVCDGMARADNWNVYWKGIMTKEIPSAISVATGMEPDFPDNRCGQRRNRV